MVTILSIYPWSLHHHNTASRLLCKNTIFKWTSSCEAAFLKLKQAIASDQVLVLYDPDLPVQLACDASPTGITGILSCIVDGHEHPIAFASRYLFFHQFRLVTDNQPLTRISNHRAALPKMTVGRLQCYAAFLSGFNYTIDFKKGIENTPININSYTASAIDNEVKQLCDATIEQISVPTVTYQLLKEETKNNATLSTIMKSLQEENTNEPDYIIESGILFRGQRVVPDSQQSAVMNELHRTNVRITKMKQLAQSVAIKNGPAKAPNHPWEPEHNWQRIHIDYAGPYQDHHFLIVVDAKSKWAEIVPCSLAPTSKSYGSAMVFTSEEFAQFCNEAGIFQQICAAGHPVTNGLAEHNVQMLKHRLTTMSNQNMHIHQKVREILFRYQATPLNNGKSLAEQYLNRQI
ncbi:hypothetical protein PR048_028822 [Dryococelus australis]|uniref:Reverse transcriptase/retrotransposon-derived protein RNase H-like domain-containing protein n=1 Tax=Dryococelus australis TaxID=614101 RepID=A0ABQ9GBM6_9NEOP|nr:hypothetical protein PR048_028822 [Dryococelus australis]